MPMNVLGGTAGFDFQEDPLMPERTLRDLDESLMRRLQQRAAAHGQPPEAEAKAILAQTLGSAPEEVWAKVDAIHARLTASGRRFSDSAELLREDRER